MKTNGMKSPLPHRSLPAATQKSKMSSYGPSSRGGKKKMIGYLGIMLLVTTTFMVFYFYRWFGLAVSGDDMAWSPSVMRSYSRVNSTDVATFLPTNLTNYVSNTEPQAPSTSRETVPQAEPQAPATSKETSDISIVINSPYAYAYVIAGCSLAKPVYKNYIYNVLVATKVLRSEGSKADVFVFFQMSYDSTSDALPEEDVLVLEKMNIKFRYIPKSKIENFFKTMLDKFRVLGLTEYRRVLFMDSDVMPTGNLDYLFELSDGPDAILKPNLVVTGREEPANGGFFMLAPGEGELEEMNEIIHQREVKAQSLPYPYFDEVEGWGHEIQSPDKWNLLSSSGTNWTFWAAFADQGLLYHWVKYAKKSVSIAYLDKIQNFGALPNGTIVLEETLDRPFANHSKPIRCLNQWNLCAMGAPRSDFVHFTGRRKPWFHGPPANLTEKTRFKTDSHFWFYELEKLNDELDLGLDFARWKNGKSKGRPLLGLFPVYGAVLTSNTNLVGTVVDDGDDNDDHSMNATRHNLTSSRVSLATNSPESQAPSDVSNIVVDSSYAYAFVIGGCSPAKPVYKNYIYNILVATKNLRSEGSKADVFVFFQMSYDSTIDTLPEEDIRLLEAMNIKFRYIPKSKIENFFKTMLDKFRVLGLTEYRRVLFMDSDVMPTGNLDYLFELSDGPDAILKPNLVVTGSQEPANGGFFMLAPGEGELEEMNEIIHQREVKAQSLPYPYFDEVEGWGHEIQSPDKWNLLKGSGTNWTFWAAFADQGLLYHWVKYAKKSVSIAYRDKIQNFGALPNGTIVLEETLNRPFANHSKPIKCLSGYNMCAMGAPRSDFVHFTGRRKPWFHGPPANLTKKTRFKTDSHFWFYQLEQLNDELDMGLDFARWKNGKSKGRPLLGMYPVYGAVLTSNTNLSHVSLATKGTSVADNRSSSGNATLAHATTTESRHHHQHLRSSAAVLNDTTVSSGQEIG